MNQFFVEIADKSGNREFGVLVSESKSELRIKPENKSETVFNRKNWFIVAQNQQSNKFKAYVSKQIK